jgi:uncharacterized protein (TIGR02594 family)
MDQSDPNICSLLGDSPGVLGLQDWGDPTLARFLPNGVGQGLVRLADSTVLALPSSAPNPTGRAPWMAVAEAQAREHKGAKEGVIEKTVNYHKDLGTGQTSLVGNERAWCAAFVNWCLKQAGYDVDNDDFADRAAAMGRAHAFYEVTKDKVKKGQKAAPKVRNPLYAQLDAPVYGAIAVVTKPGGHGHHAGFVASSPEANRVVILGGNQSNAITFTTYYITAVKPQTVVEGGKTRTIAGQSDHLMFFVPLAYEAQARADQDMPSDTAADLNKSYGITSVKPGAPASTR